MFISTLLNKKRGIEFKPDKEYVAMIEEGSPNSRKEAETMLYLKYRDKHLNILRSKHRGLSKAELRDVYVDATAAAVKNIQKGSFRGESGYEGYLSKIEKFKAIDMIRKKNGERIDYTDLVNLPEDVSPQMARDLVENSYVWSEAKDQIFDLVKDGDCLKMMIWKTEGYKDEEIAEKYVKKNAPKYTTAIAVQRKRGRCLKNLIQQMKTHSPDLIDLLGIKKG